MANGHADESRYEESKMADPTQEEIDAQAKAAMEALKRKVEEEEATGTGNS